MRHEIELYRASMSKERQTRYIVINTDEEPQMLLEIIDVMKRYDKWG